MLHKTAGHFATWLDDWKFEPIVVTTLWLLLLVWIANVYDSAALQATTMMVVALSPLWLALYLAIIFWIVWMHYIRFLYWFKDEKILLEIELPPEVEKSPHAMEVVFNGIWNNGRETTFLQRVWKGQYRAIWSFEIASNEGRINFYIHTPKGWKNFIESRIYGQYPEARIKEVPDYTDRVPFNFEEYDLWVGEYKKNDPQALPIKTYQDYELDKSTDVPETKVDPLTNLLELMNNMGKDEYLWMQCIVKARKKDEWYGFYLGGDAFIDGAKKEIKKIMTGAAERAQEVLKESDIVEGKMNALLTTGEKDRIEAMERSLDKPVFDAGVRVVYVAKKEKFFGLTGAPLFRAFEAFRSGTNELRGTRGLVRFDYPWEDFFGIRKRKVKKDQFFFYKNRAYFYVPYDQTPVFLTTEELASLWHFPGSAVKTPGLSRVSSRRGEAPSNLPTLPS